jgi:hypothetical protein
MEWIWDGKRREGETVAAIENVLANPQGYNEWSKRRAVHQNHRLQYLLVLIFAWIIYWFQIRQSSVFLQRPELYINSKVLFRKTRAIVF